MNRMCSSTVLIERLSMVTMVTANMMCDIYNYMQKKNRITRPLMASFISSSISMGSLWREMVNLVGIAKIKITTMMVYGVNDRNLFYLCKMNMYVGLLHAIFSI